MITTQGYLIMYLLMFVALLIGFIPPSRFSSGNIGVYLVVDAGGALGLGLLVSSLFYRLRKPSWKGAAA